MQEETLHKTIEIQVKISLLEIEGLFNWCYIKRSLNLYTAATSADTVDLVGVSFQVEITLCAFETPVQNDE